MQWGKAQWGNTTTCLNDAVGTLLGIRAPAVFRPIAPLPTAWMASSSSTSRPARRRTTWSRGSAHRGERSIGHTGTLDPRATGVLPLVFGRATRLASLIGRHDKEYDATIRLGVATDTDDADGRALATNARLRRRRRRRASAARSLSATYEPATADHSAKKVGGHRAYDLPAKPARSTPRPSR